MEDQKVATTFIEDMAEILDPYGDLEKGNDDFVYGSYVIWPSLDSVDDEQLLELLQYFGIEIPFGMDIDIQAVVSDAFDAPFDIVSKMNEADSTITLRPFAETREEVIAFLREQSVPDGDYVGEFDMSEDYPDRMRFLTSHQLWDDEELDFYTNTPITLIEYRDHIEEVKKSFDKAEDSMAKCSLILSALIYAECYIKSTLLNEVTNRLGLIEKVFDRDAFINYAKKLMRKEEGRNDLFKLMFGGKKLDEIPYKDIRNSLAHAIESAECKMQDDDEALTFLDTKNEMSSIKVGEIFDALIRFKLPNHANE